MSNIPQNWLELSINNPWLVGVGLNTVLMLMAIIIPKKLLTPAGLIHAWALGVIIWGTLGWRGYGVVLFYFLVGSAVTRIGMAEKQAEGIAEKRDGARGPENVWGSAFAGMICAIGVAATELDFLAPEWKSLLLLGYVASFATHFVHMPGSSSGLKRGRFA